MSTPSHTPGPWEISQHGTPDYAPQYGIYVGDKTDHVIVKGENAMADARLIASAPELLEAARNLIQATNTEEFSALIEDWKDPIGDTFLRLLEACEKAEGK